MDKENGFAISIAAGIDRGKEHSSPKGRVSSLTALFPPVAGPAETPAPLGFRLWSRRGRGLPGFGLREWRWRRRVVALHVIPVRPSQSGRSERRCRRSAVVPLGAALGVNGSGPKGATQPAKRPAKSSSSALLATTAFSHWTGLAEGGLLQPCRPRCWILADARRFAMSTDVKVRSRHRYLHDNAGIRRRMCLASENVKGRTRGPATSRQDRPRPQEPAAEPQCRCLPGMVGAFRSARLVVALFGRLLGTRRILKDGVAIEKPAAHRGPLCFRAEISPGSLTMG